VNGTAGIFSTYPADHLTLGVAIFDQIVGTACLVIAVLAASDPNNGLPSYLVPWAVAFYVVINGFTFTWNAQGAINPARDIGPRILTACAGWGTEVFTYRNPHGYLWFYLPIVFPIVGGLVGAIVYQTTIGVHWPKKAPEANTMSLQSNTGLPNIYLSQQSIEFLESLGKRESVLPLVKRP